MVYVTIGIDAHPESVTIERMGKSANGEPLVTAANLLWRAAHALTVHEQRLLFFAISRIEPKTDTRLQLIEISVTEFRKLMGTASKSLFAELHEAVDMLATRELNIPLEGGYRKFHILDFRDYYEGRGVIAITLHPLLAPFLMDFKTLFTTIKLEELFRISGRYAIAFYEYCKSWEQSKERSWRMTVAELREWLAIEPDTLLHMGHLHSRVIDQAKKELDGSSPITFRYEAIKSGRKITGWTFHVVANKPKKRTKAKATDTHPEAQPLTPDLVAAAQEVDECFRLRATK